MVRKFQDSYFAYFLMYHFYFLSFALFSTLISVYLLDRGFSATEVSILVSGSFFTSMLAQPIMGMLNDRIGIKKVTLYSFQIIIIGALCFMQAKSLAALTICYSLVLMLINGVNPVMDVLAAKSPYTYGKIRIWGTIGYALGSQLAGLIYRYVSPQAIFVVFVFAMLLSIVGVLGVNPLQDKKEFKTDSHKSYLGDLLKNRVYLYYLLIVALYSGVTNTGHTYIPSMLEESGLSVSMATTVIALAVICESPLIFYSYLFMDRFSIKTLLYLGLAILLFQYGVYALELGLTSKIIWTLIGKHAASMILIMLNLKIVAHLIDETYLVTALALVQTVRSLGTIVIQNAAGHILDWTNYSTMNGFLVAVLAVTLLLAAFLKIPEKTKKNMFA
ncbi:MFS transporter [Streptococcus himalayensis]|uniref:MFS transporter n=1 Tax=Streptococcus himalayensis TaxID=1888195 RepID=A0A917A4Q5_9STRE|nr:MFS transporter [Streptococcus himalayensis]GGE25798.1 MFS transporter [Streptococcus himalayensis]